jgi:hypothetical protein
VAHLERPCPGLDAALRLISIPHNRLTAVRQRLLGMARATKASASAFSAAASIVIKGRERVWLTAVFTDGPERISTGTVSI